MTSYTAFNEVEEVDNLVKRLEEIPITLHTLDEILFAKIKHDKTRSDFRKNVTMKIGRDIRKKLADAGLKIFRGERGDTAQRIKELEDEWRNIVKRLENMLSNEFMRGMVNMEDFNAAAELYRKYPYLKSDSLLTKDLEESINRLESDISVVSGPNE